MEHRDFVYWLQGFLELQEPETIAPEKVKIIKEHIALVLQKSNVGTTWISGCGTVVNPTTINPSWDNTVTTC